MSHHIVPSGAKKSATDQVHHALGPVGTEKVALFVDQFSPGCEANDAAATVATAKIGGISWGEGRCGRWSVSGQLVKVSN